MAGPVRVDPPQARVPFIDVRTGYLTPHALKVLSFLRQRTGGDRDDVWTALGVGATSLTVVNQTAQRVVEVEQASAAALAAVAGLRGDPRLDDAVKALEIAIAALVQVQARASGEQQKQIGDLAGLVDSLGARLTKATQGLQQQVDQQQSDNTAAQQFQTANFQKTNGEQVQLVDDLEDLDAGFTDRARASVSASGSLGYNVSTGVFSYTQPTNVSTFTNDAGYLTSVNNGNWSGADLEIANGGTGASSASAARTNLGLAIGTDIQAFNANLSAVAGLSLVSDRLIYANGTGTLALTTFTAFGRSLVDDADAAAGRSTLGLGTAATVNTGTSGATIPLLNGSGNTWSNAQLMPALHLTGGSNVPIVKRGAFGYGAGYDALVLGGQAGTAVALCDVSSVTGGTFYGNGTELIFPNGGSITVVNAAGTDFVQNVLRFVNGAIQSAPIDVVGEARCDSLRIDASPTAAAVTQTHHVPISINGATYKLLLAS